MADRSSCFFCGSIEISDVSESKGTGGEDYFRYRCHLCGHVYCTFEHYDFLDARDFTDYEKKIICINLREGFERRGKTDLLKPLTIINLNDILNNYRLLEPLEKIDNALFNLEKSMQFVGQEVNLSWDHDYPYYHCFNPQEFKKVISFLKSMGLVDMISRDIVSITPAGYESLQRIKAGKANWTQCFVAMWFDDELDRVYEGAIKPAIEYIEEGVSEPRYRAVKIDNVEHTNDINDEIIAQIRRSRFMVCDLTGYRGGVYFEAGFAYGLGLDVIYTCRKDWTSAEDLKGPDGKVVEYLEDSDGNKIRIRKEGVHFDLSHRNRIEWEPNKLDEFKIKLENRIKAVIV